MHPSLAKNSNEKSRTALLRGKENSSFRVPKLSVICTCTGNQTAACIFFHVLRTLKQEVGSYGGYGSLADSLQSCLSLVPQPPRKDFVKMLENDGKTLRYEAVLVKPP